MLTPAQESVIEAVRSQVGAEVDDASLTSVALGVAASSVSRTAQLDRPARDRLYAELLAVADKARRPQKNNRTATPPQQQQQPQRPAAVDPGFSGLDRFVLSDLPGMYQNQQDEEPSGAVSDHSVMTETTDSESSSATSEQNCFSSPSTHGRWQEVWSDSHSYLQQYNNFPSENDTVQAQTDRPLRRPRKRKGAAYVR